MKLNLKEWRRAKGISRASLASQIGVSPTTMARWEDDPDKVPIGKVLLVCDTLGVNINDVSF